MIAERTILTAVFALFVAIASGGYDIPVAPGLDLGARLAAGAPAFVSTPFLFGSLNRFSILAGAIVVSVLAMIWHGPLRNCIKRWSTP